MKKSIIAITLILIIALSIGVYTYAWFTLTTNLDIEGTEFGGQNNTVITIGDEIMSFSPMGDYMGQTGLDFYEYVLYDNLEYTYIYDDEENHVTKDFLAYDITISPYTLFEGLSKTTKIVNENHNTLGDTRTEIDYADSLNPVINIYKVPEETLWASTADDDNITVDGMTTTARRDGSLITYTLNGQSMTEEIPHSGGYYTIVNKDVTPNTYVIYDSLDDVVYDTSTISGSITIDESGEYPNIYVSLEANEIEYLGIRKETIAVGDIVEIIYNTDGTSLHKVNRNGTFYYILYNSMSAILYNEETDNLNITVETIQKTAYAIQGSDYEEEAYYTTKSFDLDVSLKGTETRDLNVEPILLGIVPMYTTESPNLDTMDGISTGSIYYTTVTTSEDTIKLFGLTAQTELVDNIETITVNNYDLTMYTLVTNTYIEYDPLIHGDLYFVTTLGYTIYYASEGYPIATPEQVAGDPSLLRVNINSNMVTYNSSTHGTIQYSTITLTGNYQLYYHEYDELAEINNYTEATPTQVGDGLNLCIRTSEIEVYDSDNVLLYEQTAEILIAFEEATIYYLPNDRFLDDFYWEVTLTEIIEGVPGDPVTYHPDENGSFVDEDEVKLALSDNKLYSCVLNLYFSNGNTFKNTHSGDGLTYSYNISRSRYEVTDQGTLTEFTYCDESYIGSHFLLRITIGSNEY